MDARDDTPSIREIADLTGRLRRLSAAGRDADPAERAAFLADKHALLARIGAEADDRGEDPDTATGEVGDGSGAAGAVAHAHALTPVTAGAAHPWRTTDDAQGGERLPEPQHDERTDAATEDDGPGWSR